MARKQRQKRRRERPHRPVVQPAPFLYKEKVVLEDIVTVTGDANSGTIASIVNANGYSGIAPAANVDTVPQARIWNQYAAMYDFYQVKGIHLEFIPFRFQGPINGQQNNLTIAFPSFTIIDPDNIFATVSGNYAETFLYSFGNCKSEPSYKVHRRGISDYTNLGISKQGKLILATNGGAATREKYTAPASIAFLTSGPTFASNVVAGYIVWKVVYEFSGRKAPGIA